MLDKIIKLLEKFKSVTTRMNGENEATIHKAVAYIKEINTHLEKMKAELKELDYVAYGFENPFAEVILLMEGEMDRVFGSMIDPTI
ncbi:hypothetical protein BV898_18591 [Hypsibius exemplaris]|uniref:Uncharacterized protein n=1 Tax=Hypsibius exemplaris TaxID=2072580 RepID=A0A9X6NPE6_HYPEX|nr:hypothetical protein BV898_18591 [Hypsibius exemplaris]